MSNSTGCHQDGNSAWRPEHTAGDQGRTGPEVLATGGVIITVEVATSDLDWFKQHPHATERRRPATAAELQMSGHPSGTMLRIVKTESGVLHRIYPRRTRS